MNPFPTVWFRLGLLTITDSLVITVVLSLGLLVSTRLALASSRMREVLEIVYEVLENSVVSMTTANVKPLVPLVLTLWLFVGVANLLGSVPGIMSPTRDLSLTAALALIAFAAGHVHAFRLQGLAYLRRYVQPSPFLLPFNILGELSRTIALALRLFGNMLSGTLVGAIFVYLAGLLIPVPLMLLSVLTAIVQAYIFGVLTLVFAASSLETAQREKPRAKGHEA